MVNSVNWVHAHQWTLTDFKILYELEVYVYLSHLQRTECGNMKLLLIIAHKGTTKIQISSQMQVIV